MDDKPLQKAKQIEVIAEPSNAVPKFATKISVAKANDNIILSFLFSVPNEKAQLINRVVLDQHLADELIGLIKRVREPKQ